MQQSESIKELATALAKAQGELEGVIKDASGQIGQQRYKYADLSAVIDVLKGVLPKHGLSFIQSPCTDGLGGIGVETLVMHASGEWVRSAPWFMPVGKQDPQGYGSGLTYGRRYALTTAFGLKTEDDDGADAGKPDGRNNFRERVNKTTGEVTSAPEPDGWTPAHAQDLKSALVAVGAKDAGLLRRVIPEITKDTVNACVLAWLAQNPDKTVRHLVSQAADAKNAAPD